MDNAEAQMTKGTKVSAPQSFRTFRSKAFRASRTALALLMKERPAGIPSILKDQQNKAAAVDD